MDSKSAAKKPGTSRLFNIISACLAFLLWGGWAYYVNELSQPGSGVVAGLTQGTSSFIMTLIMVHILTWLYHHFSAKILKLILPTLITVSISGSCLLGVHLWMGTPEILSTIAPALSVALAFSSFTTYKINRVQLILGD